MTDEQLEKIRRDSTYFVDKLQDKVHDQYDKIQELYERIFDLEDKLYKNEDRNEEVIDYLIHSHISLEEMEKIGEMMSY